MPMPTPLKPLGKKFRLKLERLNDAAQAGRANGPRIEGALWGKKMLRKLERLAENPSPMVRNRPGVEQTVEKIVERQARLWGRPLTKVVVGKSAAKPPRRNASRSVGKRKNK